MEDEFYYNAEEAAEVVWDNVPDAIREKFVFEDILRMLQTEEEILTEWGVYIPEDEPDPEVPVEFEWEQLKYEIIYRLVPENIYLSDEEIQSVLDAELVYFRMHCNVEYEE